MPVVFLHRNAMLKAEKAKEGNPSAQPHALNGVCFPTPILPLKEWGWWGGLYFQTGCQAAGGLFHSNQGADWNDQALFPESSLTHLHFHSWHTRTMMPSVVLGSVSVSKAPVIPILNSTLSSSKSEETPHKPSPPLCKHQRLVNP